MNPASSLSRIAAWWLSLQQRTRWLLCLWGFFFVLVLFGVHGSSIPMVAHYWMPESDYNGFVADRPLRFLLNDWFYGKMPEPFWNVLGANPRWSRSDEWQVATPQALSQLAHQPPFPVINTNIGSGQNMLLLFNAPVVHPTALARPATWGYLIFGAERGLAWFWWFQVFACFTVLSLLFEIVLRERKGLAAFGAFWFCSSSYVICWSLSPAYATFFPALACLSAYHLCHAEKPAAQMLWGVLTGLGSAGFVMMFYPAWQVVLGYLFLVLFVALVVRDKLFRAFQPASMSRWLAIGVAFVVGAGLISSFLISCWPAINVMSQTIYPGQRISTGGGYSFGLIFKGIYNLLTTYQKVGALDNESEAASFFYLFPVVLGALCVSRSFRGQFGPIGWALACFLVGALVFLAIGIPESMAKLTLLSYVPPYRTDIAIGLASILLCMHLLAINRNSNETAERSAQRWAWIVVGATTIFFLLHGLSLTALTKGFPSFIAIAVAGLLTGFLSLMLLTGRTTIFCGVLAVFLVVTSGFFNPLSRGLRQVYQTELAQQITRLNLSSLERPLWLCYGKNYNGTLVTTLGGRSLANTHFVPQMDLWRTLDPTGKYQQVYNRYAHVYLFTSQDASAVSFQTPRPDEFHVQIAPDHPQLKSLGARYVLASRDEVAKMDFSRLLPLWQSSGGHFLIFEIPTTPK